MKRRDIVPLTLCCVGDVLYWASLVDRVFYVTNLQSDVQPMFCTNTKF